MNRHDRRKAVSGKGNGAAVVVPASVVAGAHLINPPASRLMPDPPGKAKGNLSHIQAGRQTSIFYVMAQNRGDAPAYFALDIYDGEPRDDSLIVSVDPTKDPHHRGRLQQKTCPTDPGKFVEIRVENPPLEVKYNAKGPMVWFKVPHEIRNVFYLVKVEWNGHNMLAEKGLLR